MFNGDYSLIKIELFFFLSQFSYCVHLQIRHRHVVCRIVWNRRLIDKLGIWVRSCDSSLFVNSCWKYDFVSSNGSSKQISRKQVDHLLDGFVVSGLCRWSTTDASCRRWYKRDSILCDTLYLCSATQLGNLDVSLWTQMCRASPAGRQAASKVTVPMLGSGIGDVVIVGVIINVCEASEESSFVRESRGCR